MPRNLTSQQQNTKEFYTNNHYFEVNYEHGGGKEQLEYSR